MFTDPRFKPNYLDREFIHFHNRNPDILKYLITEALGVYGGRHMSIKYFFELLRINGFHLSNNLHSRYARLMMHVEPRLFGMFRTRSLA